MKSRKTVKAVISDKTIQTINDLEYLTGKRFELYTRLEGGQDILYNGQRMIGLVHYDTSSLHGLCLLADRILELINKYY